MRLVDAGTLPTYLSQVSIPSVRLGTLGPEQPWTTQAKKKSEGLGRKGKEWKEGLGRKSHRSEARE